MSKGRTFLKLSLIIVAVAVLATAVYIGLQVFKRLDAKDIGTENTKENGVLGRISEDHSSGRLNELDTGRAYLLAIFYPDDDENIYEGEIPPDAAFDFRPQLQSLVNNYSSLDKAMQSKLVEILFPGQRRSLYNRNNSIFRFLSSTAVFADDEIFVPESYPVLENIYVSTFDLDFMNDHGALVTAAVNKCVSVFPSLGFQVPFFRIEIIPAEIPEFMPSYSAMLPADFASLTSEPVYRIYIDFSRSRKETEIALTHELFHAFQEEILFVYPGVPMTGERLDWLREATAAWAVDQVYPEHGFGIDSVSVIYADPTIQYYTINAYEKYTWHQYFMYMTKVLESREPSYAADIFASYAFNLNLDTAMSESHAGRMFLNQDFAKLGMTLFGGVDYMYTFESADPSYPPLRMYDRLEKHPLEDISDTYDAPYREELFTSPGFRYHVISIPDDFSGQLIFQQELSMQTADQYTGMRIAVKRNDQWVWENILLEPAMHVVDVGGSLDVIDEVVLMLYSTGFENHETSRWKLTTGAPSKAKGTITVRWQKEFASGNDGDQEKENMLAIISETLEKRQLSAEGMDSTLTSLALGENYAITDLSLEYVYDYSKKTGDTEEKTIGTGSYSYDPSTESASASDSASGSDFSGELSGLGDKMKEALEGLKELAGDEYSEFIPDMPELDFEFPEGGLPGLDIFGSAPSLSRIVLRPELGVFELHPSLPLDVQSTEWVSYQYEKKYPDPQDPGSKKTETSEYNDRPSPIFPLWFTNPDYDENLQMPETEFGDMEDTEELGNMLSKLQKSLNKLNIRALIDNPQTLYELDISDSIDPAPASATMTETAMFNGKVFTATLKASVVTQKGNRISLTIEIKYEFE